MQHVSKYLERRKRHDLDSDCAVYWTRWSRGAVIRGCDSNTNSADKIPTVRARKIGGGIRGNWNNDNRSRGAQRHRGRSGGVEELIE